MQPTLLRTRRLLGMAVLLLLLSAQAATAAAPEASVPGLAWGTPFLGMLLSIALAPILAHRLWHRHMGLATALWCAALLLPQAAVAGLAAAALGAWHALLLDYLPFVTLLLAMYTIGGGILLEGGPWGTPLGNTILLALATLLSGLVGPLATSMVLVHPLLRANAHRERKVHLVVFFIVLACNVGGMTTPLGNPPLYIGLLQGVPFGWPLAALWLPMMVLAVPLLAVFWWLDRRFARNATGGGAPGVAPRPRRLHFRGTGNLVLLGVVIAAVIVQSAWHPGDVWLLGVPVGVERLAGAGVFLLVALIALRTTPLAVHQANMFGWEPMREVGILFAGIFITITPVLAMMQAGLDGPIGPLLRLAGDSTGALWPLPCFWFAGLLSAFLDNAPTYFLFFSLAGGDSARLTGELAPVLSAISAGSVAFGALTYIGNAPNMLVRAIASHRGVRMPGFFGYMAWSSALLVPGFVLLSLLFFS